MRAARRMFQERGYHAVGIAEILAEARAPKGSMYHHFPAGKEAIAVAVAEAIRADVVTTTRSLEARGLSAAEVLRRLARDMARWLAASGWQGTMLASLALGCTPERPALHQVLQEAVADWCELWAGLLVREGWPEQRAHSRAQLLLASLEGAMILACVMRDEKIVVEAGDQLAQDLESPQRGQRRARSRHATDSGPRLTVRPARRALKA